MRYLKQIATAKSRKASILRTLLVALTVTAVMLYLSIPALAQTKYVITDGDNVIVCMSSSSDPQEVIRQAGLELGESDTYTTYTADGVAEIHITRVQMISVEVGTEMNVVGSYGGTVADVLASLNITLQPDDELSCSLDSETYDGMIIRITRVQTDTIAYDEVIPHEVLIFEDEALEPGEEVVMVEGQDGLTHCKAQVTYENGIEVDRLILSEEVVTAPTASVVLRGVDRSLKEQEYSGVDTYRQSHTSQRTQWNEGEILQGPAYVPGTMYVYTKLICGTATAYYCTPDEPGITATGTKVHVGTVAVDPTVIPLGSKLYIITPGGEHIYGYAVAEDTGGAIKGTIIDLYMNTYEECVQWGRRNVLIYILE